MHSSKSSNSAIGSCRSSASSMSESRSCWTSSMRSAVDGASSAATGGVCPPVDPVDTGRRRPVAGAASRHTVGIAASAGGSADGNPLRELIPSLANTLRRCHSTVRGLMNSWAPISGLEQAVAGEPRDLRLLRGELVARLDACACAPSRRWPAARGGRARRTPPCPSRRTSRGRCAAARARRRAGARGAAIRRRAGGRGRARPDAGAAEPLDRLAVERARPPRPRSAALASAPRPRAPSRCRRRG